MTSNSRIP